MLTLFTSTEAGTAMLRMSVVGFGKTDTCSAKLSPTLTTAPSVKVQPKDGHASPVSKETKVQSVAPASNASSGSINIDAKGISSVEPCQFHLPAAAALPNTVG